MNKTTDFNLLIFLAADLRRAHTIMHGDSHKISDFRLWFGILSPRFIPILLCRLAYWFYLLKIGPISKFISLINFIFFGIEIAIRCPIGKGLFLPHTQGTVIGAWSIGENVTIFQGVTLGSREIDFSYMESSRPIVGDGVTIGSGAKVLGGLILGSRSHVGANAVVLSNIAPGSLAVGIPAKAVNSKCSDNAS